MKAQQNLWFMEKQEKNKKYHASSVEKLIAQHGRK